MNLVYYSLVGQPPHCDQWIQSIRSLRRYNRQIPVHLFYYGDLYMQVCQEAHRHNVVLHFMGDYARSFANYGNRQHAYAHFKTLHKFRNLRLLPQADQVLFLDCDTYFFADVERLFASYRKAHWYAREEVMTRRSHYGYNPDWVNEESLADVADQNQVRRTIPCNTGVCLMNHQIWLTIADCYEKFLDFAWRLLVGAHLKIEPNLPVVRDYITDHDRRTAITNYPTSSVWIHEEVAVWLMLGAIPGLLDDAMNRTDVIQGGETDPMPVQPVILAHYWTSLQNKFFNQVPCLT